MPGSRTLRLAAVTAGVATAVAVPVAAGAHPAPTAAGTPTASTPTAAGTPTASAPTAATPTAAITFPRPGGGPVAVQVWAGLAGETPRLLDPRTGRYREVPYVAVRLSPDGRQVGVEAGDRIGVADRADLLRRGPVAVRWTALPDGGMSWSPDGRALLTTTVDKERRRLTAHRLDVATGRVRHTELPAWASGAAGWAADSRRYLVMAEPADPAVADGPLRYVSPDGTAGPRLGVDGRVWDADSYSPSRRRAIVEPSRPAQPVLPATVLDLSTGRVLAVVDTELPLLGWHDEDHVVRLAAGALELVDVRTGRVTRRIPAGGLPADSLLQLGPTGVLAPAAATRGF